MTPAPRATRDTPRGGQWRVAGAWGPRAPHRAPGTAPRRRRRAVAPPPGGKTKRRVASHPARHPQRTARQGRARGRACSLQVAAQRVVVCSCRARAQRATPTGGRGRDFGRPHYGARSADGAEGTNWVALRCGACWAKNAGGLADDDVVGAMLRARGLRQPAPFASGFGVSRVDYNSFGNSLSSTLGTLIKLAGPEGPTHWET